MSWLVGVLELAPQTLTINATFVWSPTWLCTPTQPIPSSEKKTNSQKCCLLGGYRGWRGGTFSYKNNLEKSDTVRLTDCSHSFLYVQWCRWRYQWCEKPRMCLAMGAGAVLGVHDQALAIPTYNEWFSLLEKHTKLWRMSHRQPFCLQPPAYGPAKHCSRSIVLLLLSPCCVIALHVIIRGFEWKGNMILIPCCSDTPTS